MTTNNSNHKKLNSKTCINSNTNRTVIVNLTVQGTLNFSSNAHTKICRPLSIAKLCSWLFCCCFCGVGEGRGLALDVSRRQHYNIFIYILYNNLNSVCSCIVCKCCNFMTVASVGE